MRSTRRCAIWCAPVSTRCMHCAGHASSSRAFCCARAVITGAPAWTKLHRRWLTGLRFEHAVHHIVLEDYIAAVEAAEARRNRLTAQIEAMLPDWTLAPVVAALQTMRGMALVNAATLIAELGGLSPGACRRRRADRKKPVTASKGGASEPPNTLLLARLGARPRSGEPSTPLSAGSPIRCRFLARGSSATHQRSCGFDPRIRG